MLLLLLLHLLTGRSAKSIFGDFKESVEDFYVPFGDFTPISHEILAFSTLFGAFNAFRSLKRAFPRFYQLFCFQRTNKSASNNKSARFYPLFGAFNAFWSFYSALYKFLHALSLYANMPTAYFRLSIIHIKDISSSNCNYR